MLLLLLLPVVAWSDIDPDIDRRYEVESLIARAEKSPIQQNGSELPRVERDPEGKIKRLRLDGLELSEVERRAITRIASLRSLSLQGTNIGDADLAGLKRLPQLQSLNLNFTRISDEAIRHLQAIPQLRSLCLMKVNLSPEAVAELKESRPQLGIGFRRALPGP